MSSIGARNITRGLDRPRGLGHPPPPPLEEVDMAYGDNRRTPKMTRKKSQKKLKNRLKRRAAEARAERASQQPAPAAPTKSKRKAS
jgi:hypothetical protein